MSKIFLSHSSVNNTHALAVAKWLEENGWDDYFLDLEPSRGLAPGERWQEALKHAANRCEAVLILISPAWRDSNWCLAEFLLAKQLGKIIFGVLIEATPLDTLLPEMTAEWHLCDLVNGSERRTFRVSYDPIVPETEISLAEAGFTRLKIGLHRAGLDPSNFPWPPPNDPDRAPYRGLNALEAQDAAVFFGREAAIVRGLDALRALRDQGVERMLIILGASGSGKSSFLRAGLWPRLARDDLDFLPLPVVRPERAVLNGASGLAASLEVAFRKRDLHKSRATIRAALKKPDGLAQILSELQIAARSRLSSEIPVPTVVICVDQGEELFAAEGRAEAEDFLTMLAKILLPAATNIAQAVDERRQALAVIAIRSDSYERLQTDPSLEAILPQLFNLVPIPRAEFKAVIEGPAARATAAGRKLTIEPALTECLLQDAKGADTLPLLGFVLQRLFIEHGGDGNLSLDNYQTLGGMRGSIEAAVEAAFEDPGRMPAAPLEKAEREKLLRKAFVPWLASVDPQTEERKRRVARWDELPSETHPLLDRLITARLLIRDRRKLEDSEEEAVVVEVAHEALLRQWHSLVVWLDADADALKTLDSVRRAAAEWVKNERGEAWLDHTDERLKNAEDIKQRPDFHRLLGADGADYLKACRQRDDTARKEREAQLRRVARAQRRVAVLLALIALVLGSAGIWIVVQSRAVGRQTSLVLAADAENARNDGLYESSLRYAVVGAQASWLSPAVPEAEAQLARAAQASRLIARLDGHEHSVHSAEFSADGKRVVTASSDRTARVWDAASGQLIARLDGHEYSVYSAEFSADGKRVVTASHDRTARVWDAASGQLIARLDGHEDEVSSAEFSADGKRVVTASGDDTARVWDAASGQLIARLDGHEDEVNSAEFSADGKRVVTASGDDTARVWDAASGQLIARLDGHEYSVSSAEFSADGKRVVTASHDRTARVWDAASGQLIARLDGHEYSVNSAEFSADGKRVVTASSDRTARVWDAHWMTNLYGNDLVRAVCREKLRGTSRKLTVEDVQNAPLLRGRIGEDVCLSRSLLSRTGSAIGFWFRGANDNDAK